MLYSSKSRIVRLSCLILGWTLFGNSACSSESLPPTNEITQTPTAIPTQPPTNTPSPTPIPTLPPTAEDFNAELEKYQTEIQDKYGVEIVEIEQNEEDKGFYAIDKYGVARFKWDGKAFTTFWRQLSVAYLESEFFGTERWMFVPDSSYNMKNEKHLTIEGNPVPSGYLSEVKVSEVEGISFISCFITNTPINVGEDNFFIPCLIHKKYNDYVMTFPLHVNIHQVDFNIVPQPASGELVQDEFGLNLDLILGNFLDASIYNYNLFQKGAIDYIGSTDVFEAFNNPEIIGTQIILGLNPTGADYKDEKDRRDLIDAMKNDTPFNSQSFHGDVIVKSVPENLLPDSVRR